MYKLIAFFAILAAAFAAPAPEPGAAILAPAYAYNYKAPLAYGAPLAYPGYPAYPQLTYGAPLASYPAYPSPIAYGKYF